VGTPLPVYLTEELRKELKRKAIQQIISGERRKSVSVVSLPVRVVDQNAVSIRSVIDLETVG
jgi:hypothetical protein